MAAFIHGWLTAFAFLMASAMAGPADWMPGPEDRCQLTWSEAAPRAFQQPKPATEILCFQYGREELRFDAAAVRPVSGTWECSVTAEGRRFVCTGSMKTDDPFHQPVRFVEAGPSFQRVACEALVFTDENGRTLPQTGRLEISTWPDRLAFHFQIADALPATLRWNNLSASGKGSVILNTTPPAPEATVSAEVPTRHDPALGAVWIDLPSQPWSNAAGTYYPAEHLDRIDRWKFAVRNDAGVPAVARIIFRKAPHPSITGFTPVVCEPDGTPTGLPIQVSKNWHRRPEKGALPHDGQWFHGFTWIRVPAHSERSFSLAMIHARLGGICAASHAQLSLIGWGHNQLWEEIAVGSFGENLCLEPDRIQRRCFLTDIRPLMTLPATPAGKPTPKPWSWAGNCGGGDFMLWLNPDGQYQPWHRTRTEYRSPGPCLTDASYHAHSPHREITSSIRVMAPRGNDHFRAFFHLRCDIHQPIRWKRFAFFQLGADYYHETPARLAATGNRHGLVSEWQTPTASNRYDRIGLPLTGPSPWISLHGIDSSALREGVADATRGLIIRSWQARLHGQTAGPHASFFGTEWGKGNHRTIAELSPPPDISTLLPGDFVEATLELAVFPGKASDYYGPDTNFRASLASTAGSWQPVHREADGNSFAITTRHGRIRQSFPLSIEPDANGTADLTLHGGLGHIPVSFTNLPSPRSFSLTAGTTRESHWQTDWDASSGSWRATCNVPAPPTGESLQLRFQTAP